MRLAAALPCVIKYWEHEMTCRMSYLSAAVVAAVAFAAGITQAQQSGAADAQQQNEEAEEADDTAGSRPVGRHWYRAGQIIAAPCRKQYQQYLQFAPSGR